ncbi:HAD-IC family P-type ATPase, partial [Escherichia coli]|uniref:HAD-IC family P-type ATPase n=1 Tax=Escherichia coli TaxID=562 RepID=UPI002282DCEB
RNIARHMTTRKLIVDKSTVPVGTADKVRAAVEQELAARGVEVPFSVASNPEFLKEGAAINDFMSPDRVIVGADDDYTIGVMRRIYEPFQRTHDRLMVMDVRSAELTKYAANAMLAPRISFMNEMANLAEALGADIEQMDDVTLCRRAETAVLFAKLTPLQKSRVVKALQANGHTVGFLGDGINDAPALRDADVGISVDSGADIAKETADIVLLEKDLMVLEQGVIKGRETFGNILKY